MKSKDNDQLCVYMEARGQTQVLSTSFLRQVLSLVWKSPSRLGFLARESQGCPCLCLPREGITIMGHHIWLSCEHCGLNSGSHVYMVSILPTELSHQSLCVFFLKNHNQIIFTKRQIKQLRSHYFHPNKVKHRSPQEKQNSVKEY